MYIYIYMYTLSPQVQVPSVSSSLPALEDAGVEAPMGARWEFPIPTKDNSLLLLLIIMIIMPIMILMIIMIYTNKQ